MSKVKKKQRPVRRTVPPPRPREVLERGTHEEVRALLGSRRDAAGLIQLADTVFEGAGWVIEQGVEQVRPAIACQLGCSYCCHLQVGVSAPEVFRLAAYIQQNLSSEQQAAVRERLVALDSVTRGMTVSERAEARLPCALLVDDCCSVHPARPLACMGWNSLDVALCRKHFEGDTLIPIPFFAPQCEVIDGAQDGLWAGLDEAGLRPELLDLTAALRIALETPNAAARWIAGDPIFAPARIGTVRGGKFVASETWKKA